LPSPPGAPLFPYTTLFRSRERGLPAQRDLFVELQQRLLERARLFRAGAALELQRDAGAFGQPAHGVDEGNVLVLLHEGEDVAALDRKSTRLNSSHDQISYA